MQGYFKQLSFIFFLLLLSSCTVEQKFAKEFVNKASDINVMAMGPELIFKSNLNTQIVDSLGITDDKSRDSLLWLQSNFLKEINDSLLIANYMLGFESELATYGINVFNINQTTDFINLDSNAYVVNIAQLQVEEEDYDYRDETQIYDYVYYHDHRFKAININSWYEINMINDSLGREGVFYATNTITDDLNSSYEYNMFSGEVEYIYDVDSLSMPKIYEYIYLLGRIYATYTFDFIMNRYVEDKTKKITPKDQLLRYNPNNKTLFIADDNRFISMEE